MALLNLRLLPRRRLALLGFQALLLLTFPGRHGWLIGQ